MTPKKKVDKEIQPLSIRIHNFFEHPHTLGARLVQFLIFILIIAAVSMVGLELWYPEVYAENKTFYTYADYVILGLFTVEYFVRLLTAPCKRSFALKPMNVVDFIAVFPCYLEFVLPLFFKMSTLRSLRLIRIVRFIRALRLFRLLRYRKLIHKLLIYRNTVLEYIMPIISLLVTLKLIIWGLEYHRLWIFDAQLGQLFAIVGFALGIILSQKIGVSYAKFLEVEATVMRLIGMLQSLSIILNKIQPNLGTKACLDWSQTFLRQLESNHPNHHKLLDANAALLDTIMSIENQPAHLATLHVNINHNAAFCLCKVNRLTPKAYDFLLHKATIFYLLLITLFVPGLTGMISTLIASYILYGMYHLTRDIDALVGGEFNLICIDIHELKRFVGKLKAENASFHETYL
jgi:hypothetical protein